MFFVRCPQHTYYRGRGNEQKFQSLRGSRFPDVPFLDFNNFPLNNEGFVDYEHLSREGAVLFSTFFNDLIKKGLLEQDSPQKFIDREMALWDVSGL